MSTNRLILPFERSRSPVIAGQVPAVASGPGLPAPALPFPTDAPGVRGRPVNVPIEDLGGMLATRFAPGLHIAGSDGNVSLVAHVGPLSIPMVFTADGAREIVLGLAKAIEAAEGASPAGPEPGPAGAPDAAPTQGQTPDGLVADCSPDHPGLPFLPAEAATDA